MPLHSDAHTLIPRTHEGNWGQRELADGDTDLQAGTMVLIIPVSTAALNSLYKRKEVAGKAESEDVMTEADLEWGSCWL